MITLAQLKLYLNIPDSDTDNDSYLKGVISKAQSHLESYLNWESLQETEYTKKYNYLNIQRIVDNIINLRCRGVTEITGWVYRDSDNNESNLFSGDNTITNSTEIIGDNSVKVFKKIYLGEMFHIITFNAGYTFETLTGTVSTTIGDATVTGVGTAFETELAVNDYVIVGNERKKVLSITDGTHFECTDTFYSANSGVSITLTTLPDIIREKMEEVGAVIFKNSYRGDGTLRESSKTMNQGGQSTTIALKKLDLSELDVYRNYQ